MLIIACNAVHAKGTGVIDIRYEKAITSPRVVAYGGVWLLCLLDQTKLLQSHQGFFVLSRRPLSRPNAQHRPVSVTHHESSRSRRRCRCRRFYVTARDHPVMSSEQATAKRDARRECRRCCWWFSTAQ